MKALEGIYHQHGSLRKIFNMSKTIKFNTSVKVFGMVTTLILLSGLITPLPWWSFVIPVIITGALAANFRWKIPAFIVGFSAGFTVWFGASVFYDQIQNGIILGKVAHLVGTSYLVVCLISGVIGGLLSGLSLFAGYVMILADDAYKLSDSIDI